ncbi:MAG TPA: uridine diphosphate-N-acetylglucosamine-binding protein YvcK [Thermoflexales bacterium]|nr:uridine diphosphate-N-acetylglucosamine-binding protein YvcK [Thermoflexales bacterium]HQW35671.1 uridine diphosphate-N-acetylglucosamine-binding protein YvcK [Thermoflexales bacterium]HQX74973.1 uridine diphosphate-N-acetylglucosamine-binding protein YvcK [Thermoflexales bacterium]HQZ23528.1 uridine diphosphate-N-acetylglucosamine-binding protein YvcK [Thermoflexales bacterium]
MTNKIRPNQKFRQLRWLVPGLFVKRWLALMVFGVVLIGLGIGYILVDIYRNADLPNFFYYLTLQFLDRIVRAVMFGALGIGAAVYGFYRLNRTLVESVKPSNQNVIDNLWEKRIASQGPKVVAIGGGHGLSALLRGLKHHTSNITAIVTVADDGGSSGRLRRELGVLPPGDFRMCIAALADEESLVTQLMQYRFGGDSGLAGHAFGNLFIASMAELTGSFEKALLESSKVVASQGKILPSTLADVTLCAELKIESAQISPTLAANGLDVKANARGESSIGKAGFPIERVWLDPDNAPAYPDAIRAILDADLVVMGPGSLFTSVMPNVLVRGIQQAITQTRATVAYVCNVATEKGETDGFTLDDHLEHLERHIGRGAVDVVVANDHPYASAPEGVEIVAPVLSQKNEHIRLIRADVVSDENPLIHDSIKLGNAVIGLVKTEA